MLSSDWLLSAEIESQELRRESLLAAANLAVENRQRKSMSSRQGSLSFENGAQIVPSAEAREEARGRKGLVDAFLKTCQRWHLNSDDQMILLGYRPNDAVGLRVLAGQWTPSSQDLEDRVGYVAAISLGLGTLFGEAVDAEIRWLKQPRARLDGKSALEYMLESHMASLFVVARMVTHERGL